MASQDRLERPEPPFEVLLAVAEKLVLCVRNISHEFIRNLLGRIIADMNNGIRI
jgi:hypothetical protein